MNFLKKTNTWIIITTIVILALAYLFYLEYYVKSKEDSVIVTRFRVLDQIGDNINIKLGFYQKNANTLTEKAISEYQKLKRIRSESILKDSLLYNLNHEGEVQRDIVVDDIVPVSNSTNEEGQDHLNNIVTTEQIPANSKMPFQQLIVYIPYLKLCQDVNRPDVFDELIIINNTSQLVYSTLKNDVILTSKGSLLNKINKSTDVKTEDDQNSFIFSGKAFDIKIANQQYKAFLKPIDIQGNTWFALGLMQYSNYNAAVRSVPPWVIIMLSLLLVFTILALPVIKLRVITKTESLGTATLIYSALSIILGCALITMFLYTSFYISSQNQQTNERLTELGDSIQSAFMGEVQSVYKQLNVYDNEFDAIEKMILCSSRKQPSCIAIANNILVDSNLLFPSIYPFADYYFWMNDKGKQQLFLTPFNYYGTMSNLGHRDYFNKKDEWFFPGSDHLKFRMESIVSVTSGSYKVALSKASSAEMSKTSESGDSGKCKCKEMVPVKLPVAAVSSRFYSIIDPVIPFNYSFCIMDKTGKVWFHANKQLNLKENFIIECENDKYLHAALYRDLSKTMNVNYYNQPHRIYITPIEGMPLYLVTMYNKNADQSAQVQVIIITLLLIGLTLFIILIQIIIVLILAHSLQWKLTKNLILSMTRPRLRLNNNYVYLTIVSLLMTAITAPFLYYFENMHAVIAIFSMIIIVFGYAHWDLNQNPLKRRNRKMFVSIALAQLIILNIGGYILVKGHDFIPVILFDLTLFITVAICHFVLKPMIRIKSGNFLRHYIWHLLAILLLIIVLPTLKFTALAFNYEHEIRMKHTQIDLMKQLENRNKEQEVYYSKVGLDSKFALRTYRQRKYRGLYTGFINTKIDTVNYHFDCIFPVSPNDYWDTLVQYFRTSNNFYISENKYLPFNHQRNNAFAWNKDTSGKLNFWYTGFAELPKQSKLFRKKITSDLKKTGLLFPYEGIHHYHNDSILPNLIFWLLILFTFIFSFLLVRFGTRKLFCLDIVLNYAHISLSESVRSALKSGENPFITRLSPNDHTQAFYHDFTENKKHLYLDWSDDHNVSNTTEKINSFINSEADKEKTEGQTAYPLFAFIANFDYNFKDVDHLNKKLNLLKHWQNHNSLRLIVISQNHVKTLLSYYSAKKDQDNNDKNEKELYEDVIRKLEMLKSEFKECIYPVNSNWSKSNEEDFCDRPPEDISGEKLIASELGSADYLKELIPVANDFYKEHCNKNHDDPGKKDNHKTGDKHNFIKIVNYIGYIANDYYNDLYNNTSLEEKYVLFDAADDLILNPMNSSVINELLRKGLLIRKCEKINFMNISLRRFIAGKMNKVEISDVEGKIGKETGSWQGYKIMLIIIILGLFGFIAIVNEDFVNDLNQLFVAIGGVIAGITGLLGLLSKKGSPS